MDGVNTTTEQQVTEAMDYLDEYCFKKNQYCLLSIINYIFRLNALS